MEKLFGRIIGKPHKILYDLLKSDFRIKKFIEASRNYSTRACVNIISYLRECDVKSKGIGSRQGEFALLRELVYKILHS